MSIDIPFFSTSGGNISLLPAKTFKEKAKKESFVSGPSRTVAREHSLEQRQQLGSQNLPWNASEIEMHVGASDSGSGRIRDLVGREGQHCHDRYGMVEARSFQIYNGWI